MKKNILLLIPNLGPGGAQRVFHDHSTELSKWYNIYECVFNEEDGIAYPTQNKLISLDVPAGSNLVLKLYYFLLRCFKLRKVKQKYAIDICISHLEGADYINILTKGKEKVILCIHGSKLHDLNITGFLGWIRRNVLMPFLYNSADKIVTVSRDINAELIDGFKVKPHKVKTINNFFDIKKIQSQSKVPLQEAEVEALFRKHRTLITSGRLTLQKNQAPLLLIFAELIKQVSCKLIILGDGELRAKLVHYSQQLGLRTFTYWDTNEIKDSIEYDVYFLGYQSNPFKYLSRATAFVFPSAWEGFPMALCEAMICGIPVVSADCPTGPREILAPATAPNQKIDYMQQEEFGILMPMVNQPDSTQAVSVWVEGLKVLLAAEEHTKKYAMKAQQRMLEFTPDKIMLQWRNLIEKK